jgi:curved DNA-binding protein
MNAEKGAEDKFKEVAEAYEALKDPGRRAEYDELREYGGRAGGNYEPPPGWRSSSEYASGDSHFGGDFSDFFNSMFGDHGQQRRPNLRGQDAELELPVFLEETQAGTSKLVEYSIPVYENGQLSQRKKSLKVKIPEGVIDGERIRLKGQGGPGQGGGPSGDLYLHVRLVPHPLFDVEGRNLVVTVPLAPWEAALGTKVTVPTLSGKINLTISPDSQSGQKLRIKGKGLAGKTGQGDLYALLKIVMPPGSTAEQKSQWQKLGDSYSFDPRAQWSN